MTNVVLFGDGSPLIVEYEEACLQANWRIAAYVRNRECTAYSTTAAVCLTPTNVVEHCDCKSFLAPMFGPHNRSAAVAEAIALGLELSRPLVHPSAIIASNVDIGFGSFVNAGVTIGALAQIGENCVVNRAASIAHHCELSDYVSIGPGATIAGQVKLSAGVMVGTAAVIAPGVVVGENARIGAAAFVRRDVPAGATIFAQEGTVLQPTTTGNGGED